MNYTSTKTLDMNAVNGELDVLGKEEESNNDENSFELVPMNEMEEI